MLLWQDELNPRVRCAFRNVLDIAGIPQHCRSLLFTETGDFRPVGLTEVDHDIQLVDHFTEIILECKMFATC